MRRYRLPMVIGEGRRVVPIQGRDHHYLARVLRLSVGDDIDAVDATGRPCRARVVRREAKTLELEVWAADSHPLHEPVYRVHLYPCLPKGRKMDIIVRQATEAGAASITPVRSERALGDPSPAHVERWTRIAVEALQQSGRSHPPLIHPPVDLGTLASQAATGEARSLFFHEDGDGSERLHVVLCGAPETVHVLVGPEGGLSPQEAQQLRARGWRQAWLGPTVLRCETAAIAALTAVTIVLLESDTWKPRVTGKPISSASPSTA